MSVAGVPAGQSGWSTPTNLLLWLDESREVVTGALTRHEESEPTGSSRWTPGAPGAEHRLDTEGAHRLTVAGHLDTSHGRITTTVTRAVRNTSLHRWADGENHDALTAHWTDEESVTRGPTTTRTTRTYTMDGETTLGAGDRLRTVLSLGDRADTVTLRGGRSRPLPAPRRLHRRRHLHGERPARPAARGRHHVGPLPAVRLGRRGRLP